MKKNIIYPFIILGVLLLSCGSEAHIEPPVLEDSFDSLTLQYNVVDADIDDNKEYDTESASAVGFINLFSGNWRYFQTTLLNDTMLYSVDGNENTAIEKILAGTEITILAQSSFRNNLYYLVKTDGESNMWSGWIRSEYIAFDVRETIHNWGVRFLTGNVSTRNNILVTTTGWSEDIIVVRRSGEILHRISIPEIFFMGYSGRVVGWTVDETEVWVMFNMDAVTTGFGIINIKTGELTLFAPPPGFAVDFALDPDTGYIWYDDHPFFACAFTSEAVRASGRVFSLFAFNFFTGERMVIDTNIGVGFRIVFDEINGFTFQRMN